MFGLRGDDWPRRNMGTCRPPARPSQHDPPEYSNGIACLWRLLADGVPANIWAHYRVEAAHGDRGRAGNTGEAELSLRRGAGRGEECVAAKRQPRGLLLRR